MRNRAFSRIRGNRFAFSTKYQDNGGGSNGENGMQNGAKLDNGECAKAVADEQPESSRSEPARAEKGKTRKALKRVLPHVLLLAAASLYIVGGGYAFYMMERHFRPTHPSQQSPPSAANAADNSESAVANNRRQARSEECSPSTQFALVEASRRECVRVAKNDTNAHETHSRYCAMLLLRLSWCLKQAAGATDVETADFDFLNTLASTPTSSPSTTTAATTTTTTTTTTVTPTTTATTTEKTTTATQKTEPRTTSPPIQYKGKEYDTKIRSAEWTPATCTFMAFTIISTIGYGDVAPVTLWGRLFCIVYGLFGIPLALLAVADQGRFLTEFVLFLYKRSKKIFCQCCRRRKKNRGDCQSSAEMPTDDKDDEDTMPAFLLLGLFALYLVMGGFIFTRYETHWSFVDAVYFTFISSATIGFGDVLPSNQTFLPLTLLYIALGLALATAAIDICAEYLRRLHHFGTKIRNCANKLVWFGGKRLTIAELVRTVGIQLGVPEEKIQDLVENFDAVVEQTIQEKENLTQQQPIKEPELLVPIESESTMPQETFSVQIPFIDSPCTSDRDKSSLRTNTNF